jgi:hypothetical protein
MRHRASPFRFAAPLALALLLVPQLAEARKALGAAIPANAQSATLSAVLATPARFHDKAVVLRGTVNAQCASLCEFTFQDGPHKSLIYPQGFKLPKLRKGEAVTLYARVTAGEQNVVLTALGLERK